MTADLFIPADYRELLSPRETERAILKIKDAFQTNLAFELDLVRVTAPLFVKAGTGVNDDLNGIEKPVSFQISALGGTTAEIVQSLAKWKRMALADLEFKPGEGLYTDMNAIRPDEVLDNVHSLYVDQWDWERVICAEQRNVEFLKRIVRRIYDVIRRTEKYICHEYHVLKPRLPEQITFFHAEELAAIYPDLSPKERETEVCRKHGAVFVIGIGAPLQSGEPHDGRAPDYDDWTTETQSGQQGLNGDILVYNHVLETAFELSSMGIRVDGAALLRSGVERLRDIRLLVVDVDLPQRSGLDCLRELRLRGARMPAIVVTGGTQTGLEDQLDPHTQLLRKPFGMAEFERLASELVAAQRGLAAFS